MASDTPQKPKQVRRGTGQVRLFDVAKIAGVAPITVSRAINTPNQLSAETLRKVRAAIERTGFVPNLLAGGLASSRSHLIAAIVPSVTTPVFQDTIGALTDTFTAAGFQLMLGQSAYSAEREDELLTAIVGRRTDGIVLVGIERTANARQMLIASGIPVVETWDLTLTPIDMLVGFSHEAIGASVADYLLARGRRHIGLITATDERALRRAKGMSEALARRQPEALLRDGRITSDPPGTIAHGQQGLAALLERHPHVDAIFCSSDTIALGVMHEARRRNIRIPEQIALVGHGDLNFAPFVVPSLTSVRVNSRAIGELAARYLIQRIQGEEPAARVTDVGFSIVERESA